MELNAKSIVVLMAILSFVVGISVSCAYVPWSKDWNSESSMAFIVIAGPLSLVVWLASACACISRKCRSRIAMIFIGLWIANAALFYAIDQFHLRMSRRGNFEINLP